MKKYYLECGTFSLIRMAEDELSAAKIMAKYIVTHRRDGKSALVMSICERGFLVDLLEEQMDDTPHTLYLFSYVLHLIDENSLSETMVKKEDLIITLQMDGTEFIMRLRNKQLK